MPPGTSYRRWGLVLLRVNSVSVSLLILRLRSGSGLSEGVLTGAF